MKRRCVSILICGALLLSGCSSGNTSDNVQNDSYVVDKEITISFDFGDRIGVYTGTIDKDGLPDGFGMFKTANDSGNDWIYYGEWENGHMDGNGITQWDNYSHYGIYESDYMEGVGMYYMDDGAVYCGEFEKSNLISSYIPENAKSDNSLTSLDDAKAEAEELADNAKKITSGELYDKAVAIYPNIQLIDMGKSLSVQINIAHDTIESDAIALFYIASKISESCSIESNFSSVNFTMCVDDAVVAMLTLLSYESPYSYKSDFIVLEDSYEDTMENIYDVGFLSYDIQDAFDAEVATLKEKYDLE